MIESSRLLVDEANANYGQTTPADRPGRAVPGRADPQRRRHQVAGRRAWRGSPPKCANADPQLRDVLQTVPGGDRRGQHHVQRDPAVLPDAGGQPRQLRPDRRHLPQVDRTGAGGLPRADGRADHRRRRRAGRRGRQAGLQGRPARPAAVLGRASCRRPRSGRPADETLRELPKDLYCKAAQNDPAWCAAPATIRARSSRASGRRRSQLCRDPQGYVPIGSNPWRGPPVPVRHTGRATPRMNILPTNKFPYHPAAGRP